MLYKGLVIKMNRNQSNQRNRAVNSPDYRDTRTTRQTKAKKSKVKTAVKWIFLLLLLFFVLIAAMVGGAMLGFVDNSTDLIAQEKNLDFSSIVYYIDEETGEAVKMEQLYAKQNRIWVDLDKIPKDMRNAFVAIEDERFEQHRGVDWKRTFGAFFKYITGNSSYGGSTITQQLIKNVTGDDDRSPIRKVQEIVRALNLERKMSKDQIVEMYMNTIYLGQGCHGVQAASNIYYSKDVSQLDLAECASIAGITQYPSKYDPLVNYEEHKKKQELVLRKMMELGYIDEAQYEAAKNEELKLKKGTTTKDPSKAQSYFVDMVVDDVIHDLMAKEKMSESQATKTVYQGGLKIYTTVNPKIQTAMETVFTNNANFPKLRDGSQPQAAMMIIDPTNGQIRGVVGGRGTKSGDRVLNRATQTLRQPGSSIKPLSVYSPSIEYGLVTPATIINDSELQIGSWKPKNDDGRFLGDITVRRALEGSRNIPAIKLLDKLTVERSFDFLTNNLGITSLVNNEKRKDGKTYSDKYMSSLALGGLTDGISLKELTAAYQPFVNGGVYTKPISYTKVIDSNGRILLENHQESSNAMSAATAYITANMLNGATTYGTGGGANLSNGMFTGGKTGTTDDDFDRWFSGITPYYVGAVWCGYDTPRKMSGIGYNPSLRVWKKVMEEVHKGLPQKSLDMPKNVVKQVICQNSGKIAAAACEAEGTVRTDYFKAGTAPTSICSSHSMTPSPDDDRIDDTIEHGDAGLSGNPGEGAAHSNPPAEGEPLVPSAEPSASAATPPAVPEPNNNQPSSQTGIDDTIDWYSGEEE